MKDYKVREEKTGNLVKRYIKVMRGYCGDENTEDGRMRGFLDEMTWRIRKMRGEKRKRGDGEGKQDRDEGDQKTGDGDRDGEGDKEEQEKKDMSTLEERERWKAQYLTLKRMGERAVARAKRDRKPGEDMDMDFDDWCDERREEIEDLMERWFEQREGLVEEFEVDRGVVEFALFEYGGGDGLGLRYPDVE